MNYFQFFSKNLKAYEKIKFSKFGVPDVYTCNRSLRFRGFVNCVAAQNEDSFVMFTNADDIVAAHYLYAGPATFESGTLKLWTHLAKCSSWIYDVGSFTGVFALAAATANPRCRIMAFEPSFITYSRLLVNIMANEFDGQIAPVRAGLGSEQAELDLHHSSGVYVMASDETFRKEQAERSWFTEKVQIFSLDYLLAEQHNHRKEIVLEIDFSNPDLIKIDVEGFEKEVIRGMRQTIIKSKPLIIMEILDQNKESLDEDYLQIKYSEILDLLGTGYHIKNIDEESGILNSSNRGKNNLLIHDSKLHLIEKYCR